MNKTAHLTCGAFVGLASITYLTSKGQIDLGIDKASVLVIASMCGSLLPDLDTPTSAVGQKAKPVSKLVNILFGHRGLLHTPLFTVAFVLCLYLLQTKLQINHYFALVGLGGIALGYVSHLILDFLTPQGIMLFFPISTKYYHLFGFKGKEREIIFTSLFLIGNIYCLYILISPYLKAIL